MAIEIEHKFLLANDNWKQFITHSANYKQGYLASDNKRSIRVRLSDDQAWLNIKSATIGSHRMEFEYKIPQNDALEILKTLCEHPIIEKTRYFVPFKQHIWEIDVFEGANKGLIVAEIELTKIGEAFTKPEWIGEEVTEDIKYYNNSLCKCPYKNWKK